MSLSFNIISALKFVSEGKHQAISIWYWCFEIKSLVAIVRSLFLCSSHRSRTKKLFDPFEAIMAFHGGNPCENPKDGQDPPMGKWENSKTLIKPLLYPIWYVENYFI